ncbi:MAG: hypothetical protein FJ224_11345, partial [Lentisphaerae bacterium]|nr:hypothetical protein [Lentisphaerota bacterium]
MPGPLSFLRAARAAPTSRYRNWRRNRKRAGSDRTSPFTRQAQYVPGRVAAALDRAAAVFSGAGGGVREEFEVGIDFRNSLNPEQYAAATAPDGPALVLAAAGTGKTRTLVHRVAFLVERGVSADRILLLTFTNRAAKEMLERARALAGDGAGGIWGGTFHHMANRLLRRHAPLVGYKSDFTILDRDDAESLIAECVKQRNLNRKEFPKKDVLMGIFSAAANRDKPIGPSLEARFDGTEVDPDDVLLVLRDYQSRKKQLDAMDF